MGIPHRLGFGRRQLALDLLGRTPWHQRVRPLKQTQCPSREEHREHWTRLNRTGLLFLEAASPSSYLTRPGELVFGCKASSSSFILSPASFHWLSPPSIRLRPGRKRPGPGSLSPALAVLVVSLVVLLFAFFELPASASLRSASSSQRGLRQLRFPVRSSSRALAVSSASLVLASAARP